MDENKEILPNIKNIKSQESYTLPSKGLVYAPEDKIPASVSIRRMTTKEEKIRLRNESEDKIRRDLLQACVLDQFDVNKLKLEDANFLLFRLRSLSLLDDTYKVRVRCGTCGTEFVHQINLSEVPIEYMKDTDMSKFKMELPLSKAKIDFKLPSIGDIISMGDTITGYLERFPNADRGELIYTLSQMVYIDKVNGQKMINEVLEDYLDNLDIIDTRALRERVSKVDGLYGFSDKIECKCPKCNKIITHGLPITEELFNPSSEPLDK